MRANLQLLPLVVLVTFAAGCPHRQPAAPANEDWYLKNNLFAALDADARDLSMVNGYLLELACYVGDRGTFEVEKVLSTWGFDQKRDFRDLRTSTYGFVASNNQVTLVTFGGTDIYNLRDILSDADALELVHDDRYCPTPEARVHRGFRDSLNSVIDGVMGEVKRQATAGDARRRVWVAGHSRGGAFAQLAAAAMAKQGVDVAGVYTFGQPRVGNGAFNSLFSGDGGGDVPLFRFVNGDDPVPQVPPEAPSGGTLSAVGRAGLSYTHGGVAVHLRPDGTVVKGAPSRSLADVRAAGINSHYQPAYHTAIYAALTDPSKVREPAWRQGSTDATLIQALPRPAR
ncbi:MAG TPA: lipase family protein [Tepidisphaeraceae bacterium]|jgi:lipase (class 3)|nr:lipase family protein [Tepidisphaeraceae bacterium]